MSFADADVGPIETLIGFKLDKFDALHGPAVLMRLQVASSESGVQVIAVHCTEAWAAALANRLAEATQAHSDLTNPHLEETE